MIVADTNLVSYLLIEGERTPVARRVWQKDSQWILPPLWRSEFLSVLATSVRSSLLTIDQASRVWHHASRLFKGSEYDPEGEAVLQTAVRCGLSAYDAHFVVVAEELSVTLVTGDREVAEACPQIATELEAFAAGDSENKSPRAPAGTEAGRFTQGAGRTICFLKRRASVPAGVGGGAPKRLGPLAIPEDALWSR